MSTWEETVSAALVGVRTRPVTLDGLDPVVTSQLPESDTSDPVTTTLTVAALTAAAHQAVGVDAVVAEPIPPAPHDARPAMSPMTTAYVHRALHLTPRLAQWCLQFLADNALQPPPTLLPELLARTTRDVAIRDTIDRIVGPRGRWLAEHAPELGARLTTPSATPFTGPPNASVWTHGTSGQRRIYLAGLRDRDPVHALDLLTRRWPSETGEDRQLLITALRHNISQHDEQFLESALDDRRKGVRTTAAELLDLIPGSALQERLFRAAATCLRLVQTRRLMSVHRTIEVTRPAEPDASLAHDGISLKAPRGIGLGAFVLSQLVSRVPPTLWEEHFALTPQEIVAAIPTDQTELIHGLCTSSINRGESRWANVLLAHPAAIPEIVEIADEQHLTDAFSSMPAPLQLGALRARPSQWPDVMCRTAVAMVQEALSGQRHAPPLASQIIDLMSTGLPVTDSWRQTVEAMRESAPIAATNFATLSEALRIRSVLEREVS